MYKKSQSQKRGSSKGPYDSQQPNIRVQQQSSGNLKKNGDLLSRLYDKGFNPRTMPSVKRPQTGQKGNQRVLAANLQSYKNRINKEPGQQLQPQSVVLNQQNFQMEVAGQTLRQQQLSQQQQFMQQQQNDGDFKMTNVEDDLSEIPIQSQLISHQKSMKRAQTAKSRVASSGQFRISQQQPQQFQDQQQQQLPDLNQDKQAKFFGSGSGKKPMSAMRPKSNQFSSTMGPGQQSQKQFRATTAQFRQSDQGLDTGSQQNNNFRIQTAKQRVQSGLTGGVDYKEHIYHTREVFGMPRAKSGRTLPPMSGVKSGQKNIKLNEMFSKTAQSNNFNILEEDLDEEQLQDYEYIDRELDKHDFEGDEKKRTHVLVDKITGKRFIDKRYLPSASSRKSKLKDIEESAALFNDGEIDESHKKMHDNQESLQKEEEAEILASLKKLREPSKLDKYIDLILKNVTNVNEFMYLKRRKLDDPYDLQVVNFKVIQEAEKNKSLKEYYTISKKGLCHYVNGKPIEFIQLAYWLKERETYDQITQLKFFMNFRRWKTLKMWKRNVTRHKVSLYSRALEEKLFILNPILKTTLLEFRARTDDMGRNLRFIGLGEENYAESTFTLDQFKEHQDKKRKEINDLIQQQSKECRKIVQKGFDESLAVLKKNQYMANNDEEVQPGNQKKNQNFFRLKESAYENLGFSDNMNYEKRSELRKECSKFLRFSYLVDFLAMESLSQIFKNSVRALEEKLKSQVFDPSEYIICQDMQRGEPLNSDPLFSVQMMPNFDEIKGGFNQQPLEEFMPLPYGDHTAEHFNPLYHLKLRIRKEKQEKAEGLKKHNQQAQDSESEFEDDTPNEETVYDRQIVANITKRWLRITPDRTAFFNDLMKCIAEGANSIQAFERWSRHDQMTKYVDVLEEWDDMVGEDWEHPDSNYLNPSEWLSTSPNEMFEDIFKKLIDNAFDRVDKYATTNFEDYLQTFWENQKLNFRIYEDELLSNPGMSIEFSILKFKIWQETFKTQIPLTADLGLIKVDTKNLRETIKQQPDEMLKKFQDIIPPMLAIRVQEIQDWMKKSIDSVRGTGLNIGEFVQRQNQLEIIEKVKQKHYDRFGIVNDIWNKMEVQQYEFKSKEELKLRQEIQVETKQLAKKLDNLILTAAESSERYLEKYARELNQDLIPKLESDLITLNKDIQKGNFFSLDKNMDEAIKQLEDLSTSMQELDKRSLEFNNYQKTLQQQITRWEDLEECKEELTLRRNMWVSLRDWQILTAGWIDGKFKDINVQQIKQKSEQYTKIIQKCVKRLPQNEVLDKLKALVYDFKDTMPVVVALRNPDLQDYHWAEIKNTVGENFVIEEVTGDEFTLKQLMGLEVGVYFQEIQDISTQATQEAVLEKNYIEQFSKWDELTFVIAPYSRSKDSRKQDAILLDEIDILFTALDDLLANVNNILGSRYLKKIREKVDKLQKSILYCQETLDNWVAVQKNWIYFDNIFQSSDIKAKLPTEFQQFDSVDKFFKQQLNRVKKNSHIHKYMANQNIKKEWIKHKDTFNTIQQSLDNLLEDKRSNFPRFYFLSNDELLEILAKAQDRGAIQKNIKKCFDGIQKLVYNESRDNSIQGMESPEKEYIEFNKNVQARGEVEVWLQTVQDMMKETLVKRMKLGRTKYNDENAERHQWVLEHPCQVVATVAQVMWCACTEAFIQQLEKEPSSLYDWYGICLTQLEELTKLISTKLTSIQHRSIVALITQDVHCRDIVNDLYDQDVDSLNNFIWQKQLRYYYEDERQDVTVKQVNAVIKYGFEYMGATSRLVITQLTDRCWLTITGALNIQLGAAPAGPAGTGKTESTKDLGKGLGMLCVVFNCSEQIEYKMMGRLFAGLSEQGAWACLDEFNRIDIEVLSVIAQQLLTIRQALLKKDTEFLFGEKKIKLQAEGYGVFITMNPGYAGRTELPDNLKVLFRPVSMMIPDYSLIAEIMLFAEGFEHASSLSKKMTQLYKLSSEQLSQQDHYDFGMRAVKSVLVMAGAIKRQRPEDNEDAILIRAMIDSNVPKFLKEDLPLFNALIQDLFPTLEIKQPDYGELTTQFMKSIEAKGLQYVPGLETKVIQLFETFNVRFGVMLVGETMSGKTCCFEILQHIMTSLFKQKTEDQRMQIVNTHIINPKCISMGELYGEVNPFTQEWHDGLASSIMRDAASEESEERQWVVFDGPVDALWIENMNTVLDDNMMLCLANGQRIKLRTQMKMLFEVQDLKVASPATVSRCGMVYMVSEDLGWQPYAKSWVTRVFGPGEYEDGTPMPEFLSEELREYILEIFDNTLGETLQEIRESMLEPIATVDAQLVTSLCNLLECFLSPKFNFKQNPDKIEQDKRYILHVISFSFIWSIGCTISEKYYDHMNAIIREMFKSIIFPNQEQVYGYYLDMENDCVFQNWNELTEEFVYSKDVPFFNLLVPTVDVCRYSFFIEQLLANKKNVYVTGPSGSGKSVIVSNLLKSIENTRNVDSFGMIFSAQTSSLVTQYSIEDSLQTITKQKFGAKPNHTNVIFIDDINMPAVEEYGAQPPIELLRLLIDKSVFYDRKERHKKQIFDTNLICVSAPPGGGRSNLTPRFTRHFNILCLPQPGQKILSKIFESLLSGFFNECQFSDQVKQITNNIVQATIETYQSILTEKLPIPSKFHYTFNLRDVSKVFQGIMMTLPQIIFDEVSVIRLWVHEVSRVFHDRLINEEDKEWFYETIMTLLGRNFKPRFQKEDIFIKKKILFTDLLRLDYGKEYEEVQDMKKLLKVLDEKMDDYNSDNSSSPMHLVFFQECIEHILRISRILRQPRGNAMLIGVGGSGKQSLTKLSSYMLGYSTTQVEISKNFGLEAFREFIQEIMKEAGVEGKHKTFLFTDTQIVNESFLEDINNILNSGEIPNLWNQETKSQVVEDARPYNAKLKRPEDPDTIYKTFVERVRDNLRIVLCMSPVGDALRVRCRQFPSLVDCCSLDWFSAWPSEALYSVAKRILTDDDEFPQAKEKHEEMIEDLANLCRDIHLQATEKAVEFEQALKRKVYTTPKSYLDLIKQYQMSLKKKRKELQTTQYRLSSGLQKLQEANVQVNELQITLTELKPKLKEQDKQVAAALKQVEADTTVAQEQEAIVEEETEKVQKKKDHIQLIADDAQAELDKCLPELQRAQQAVEKIDKNQLISLRTMTSPPQVVEMVFGAVCILMGMQKTDWASAKTLLQDTNKFIASIINMDKDSIPQRTLKKLTQVLAKPEFDINKIKEKVSYAADMALFCKSVKIYADVSEKVKPKKEQVAVLQKELDEANAALAKQEAELQVVKDRVNKLQEDTKIMVLEKEQLEKNMELTEQRLINAKKLISLTASEKVRWEETVKILNTEIEQLFGDVFLASAEISYNGPFTGVFRNELITSWDNQLRELNICRSESYNIKKVLGDPMLLREWVIQGLPSDSTSQDSSIYVKEGYRWPLLIDPQIQASKWLKNMEKDNDVKIIKFSNPKFANVMNLAIPNGYPVIIEDVDENIDPIIDSILAKAIYDAEGRILIKFADKEIDYHKDFRIYLTTKKPNPKYLPEIFIKVTVINFTATFEGLEDQLLVEVVKNERPEIETQRDENVRNLAQFRKKIEDSEKEILKLLAEANADTILDDVNLIKTLEDSKETSIQISERLVKSKELEVTIEASRNQYRKVSIRGSILFFVIKDLALIDPMYQYSLQYVQKLFVTSLQTAEQSEEHEERLENLIDSIMKTIFTNVSRGLFEKDKVIFSFLCCTQININAGILDADLWSLFLRGAPVQDKSQQPPNPDNSFISPLSWDLAYYLDENFERFKDFTKNVTVRKIKWKEYSECEKPLEFELPEKWDKLDQFEKIMILKMFRPEKILFAVQNYVGFYLGKFFLEFPTVSMGKVYSDSDNKTPIIFVLSQGADPTQQIVNYAKQQGMEDKLIPKSLGQGQGTIAARLIETGKEQGNWVFLMNCHLSRTWMPELEQIVYQTQEEEKLHKDYRLFLTSMPTNYFPVSILQNGIKLTTEPPRGFKSNLKRSWDGINDQYLECSSETKKNAFHKIVWGLTYFHAIIQVRRKFGPLGWNIRYEFNDSDLETSTQVLKMLLEEQEDIPWDSMLFIAGHINYGGRVTDDIDRVCLLSNLKRILLPALLTDGYQFSESPTYIIPGQGNVESYKDFIETLPIEDEPSAFGMHENANIAFQGQESEKIIQTILSIQTNVSTKAGGKSSDEIVIELVESLLEDIPECLSKDQGHKELFEENEMGLIPSLSTVLLQEMVRFQRLIEVITTTLQNLKKAINGIMVMSSDLDSTYQSLMNNQVPKVWEKVAYPSLKPLTSWVKDLNERIDFMNKWMAKGNPNAYWISGFFFPQGFMTGVLQTHARNYQIPIDELQFQFRVIEVEVNDINFIPEGVFIHGLFIQGATWNSKKKTISDSEPGKMFSTMPVIQFTPTRGDIDKTDTYKCPVYKTTVRAGTLNTTGHSTNFVLPVDLPSSEQSSDFWVLRGTAMICQLND